MVRNIAMISPLPRAAWVVLLIVIHQAAFAQAGRRSGVRPVQRTSVVVLFGVTNPQSHERLREFWLNGPGGAAEFRIHLGPLWSLGAGGEISILYFNQAAFNARYPGVPIKTKENLFVGNVYADVAYTPLPTLMVQPYMKTQVGAAFVTEATYRMVTAGVQTTYYSVGGTPRLTLGVAAGFSLWLGAGVGLLAEVKALYVHRDPAFGLLLHGRGGVQFRF
jgi:hypothetical protein